MAKRWALNSENQLIVPGVENKVNYVVREPPSRPNRIRERDQNLTLPVSRRLENIKSERRDSSLYSLVLERKQDALISRRMINNGHDFKTSDDTLDRSSSINSSKSAGSRRDRSSRIFSFFKWFRRDTKSQDSDFDSPPLPGSPILTRGSESISGSVDTLFSTATATSFAFVPPSYYRPFGNATQAEICIALGPETNTYKNRIRERDQIRQFDKNISLKEKYRLYASNTLPRSVDRINEINENISDFSSDSKSFSGKRKKRKAPPPPPLTQSENCLPTTVEAQVNDENLLKQHRRALSEPVKYIKVCHIKGKRKAPPPPTFSQDTGTSDSDRTLSLTRKKRPAPAPPLAHKKRERANDITNTEEQAYIVNDTVDQDETASNASTIDIGFTEIVSTDTLRLERGILRPNKMERPVSGPKFSPSSPVSPRPWYKRNSTSKEQVIWKLDKKKEKEKRESGDWMLENGFPRRTNSAETKCNIFSKIERPEDKRKSQISILTNISELDREAAEIVKKNKAIEQANLESHDAAYYTANQTGGEPLSAQKNFDIIKCFSPVDNLIQTNSPNCLHFKEENLNGLSDKGIIHRIVLDEAEIRILDTSEPVIEEPEPSPSGKIARVTIEELDEYDAERNSKSQAIFEANRMFRHQSPPIPTIAEVSESSAKSSSPASTINSSSTNESTTEAAAPANHKSKSSSSNILVWSCPRCTLENSRWKITCEVCDTWRPIPCEFKEQTNRIKEPLPLLKIVEPQDIMDNNLEIKDKDNRIDNILVKPQLNKNLPNNLNIPNKLEKCIEDINILETKKSNATFYSDSGTNDITFKQLSDTLNILTDNVKDEQTEQTRNARLAFFKKDMSLTKDGSYVKSSQTSTENLNKEIANDLEENRKILREMLKEMKYSLPKRPKSVVINDFDNKKEEKSNSVVEGNKNSIIGDKELYKNNTKIDKDLVEPLLKKNICEPEPLPRRNINRPEPLPRKNINEPEPLPRKNINEPEPLPRKNINEPEPLPRKNINEPEPFPRNNVKEPEPLVRKSFIELEPIPLTRKNMTEPEVLPRKIFKEPEISQNKTFNELEALSMRNFNETEKSTKKNFIEPDPSPRNAFTNDNSEFFSRKESDVAEAYLIESETIIEEIKMKKTSEKVSSSAQTSAMVRQISPRVKPPVGKEVIVPITVEEYKIRDGVLYTSISKEAKKIGSGKFQLMRPRDFASIEAIKTNGGPTPLYANIQQEEESKSGPSTEPQASAKTDEVEQLSMQLTKPHGLANFRAGLADDKTSNNLNTMAVNRLLKRLELAIANGQHELAAALAKELAQLKINCSVTRQKNETPTSTHIIAEMYVEDKESHQGPFPLKIDPRMTVAELKHIVENEYELPIGVQRWILGKALAIDDKATLESMGVTTPRCPIFLYLVAPGPKDLGSTSSLDKIVNADDTVKTEKEVKPEQEETIKEEIKVVKHSPFGTLTLGWKCLTCTLVNSPTRPGCAACGFERPTEYNIPNEYKVNDNENERIQREIQVEAAAAKTADEEKQKHYQKLIDLEKDDLIVTLEKFECPICFVIYEANEGVLLRECLHVFCKGCLAHTVEYSEEAEVKCPYRDEIYTCDSTLLEREIKALVTPDVYEGHLAKSIALAETKIGNAFHCKTPDCKGWCIYEDNVNIFRCPVCTHTNCVTCQAIHEGLNCKQFQEHLNSDSETNIDSKRTKEMLQEMVDRGEAMNCPTCQVVLMKKWGCDWLRCSMCKTEICWITRGPRWGPNGKGDTTGGCQCGVNGIKCHPKCTYCH